MPDEPDEHQVVTLLTRTATDPPAWLAIGPGDDCAVLDDGTALSTDLLVEGVHWDGRQGPEDLGFKAVMVNASDLAAMGAVPRWALLSVSLPQPIDPAWLEAFRAGLHAGLDRAGLTLVGGDTTRSPGPKVVGLSVGGTVAPDRALRRCGGEAHDDVWVSGMLGDAAAGFLLEHPPDSLWAAHARPQPPLHLGPALAEHGLATAAMDLSDGLATDLLRLCRASGVGAAIDSSAVPVSSAFARAGADPSWAVSFGEDYQLLFSAAPRHREAVARLGRALDLRLTRIGALTSGSDVHLDGGAWPAAWTHFGAEA